MRRWDILLKVENGLGDMSEAYIEEALTTLVDKKVKRYGYNEM